MKSIKQIDQDNDTNFKISSFLKLIGLGEISRKVNFKRRSFVSLTMILSWLMSNRFTRHSLYRAQASEKFSIRTVRNVLCDGRINWQKLVCLVAVKLISCLKPVIDKRRRLALIVDDTLMSRSYSKKTELLARVYDHDKHKFLTGYRGLTLGWSDGNTYLPVNFALMSTKSKKNMVGSKPVNLDNRSIAGKRRSQAQRKMNDVTVELINQAIRLGVPAKYVLFDSWFAMPRMFWLLKQRGLYGVGMIKSRKNTKVYYTYRNKKYNAHDLYEHFASSNMSKKTNYLYSCVVTSHYKNFQFLMRLVFVTKRGSKGKFLVLATTKISLTPDQIIQLYGRRWQIETYFKAAKQYLALDKSQIQNYDGQCGYIASTAIAYDLLAWQERQNTDDKTIGDLFYLLNDYLPDIKFENALVYLLQTLKKLKQVTENIIEQLTENFINQLPKTMQKTLRKVV